MTAAAVLAATLFRAMVAHTKPAHESIDRHAIHPLDCILGPWRELLMHHSSDGVCDILKIEFHHFVFGARTRLLMFVIVNAPKGH